VLNAGEYGKILRINTGYNLGGATALSLSVTRPDGSVFTRDKNDVSVGSATIQAEVEQPDGSVAQKTFTAGEYVEYTLQSGDIPDSGRYRAKLQVDFGPTQRLITVSKVFKVRG